jgi:Cu(I)/Ag(I) efflux system membrane fusion protein
MNKAASLLCLSVLAATSFVMGARFSHVNFGASASAATHPILYYACPMHPRLRSEHPGDCMACGMKLEPVYNQTAVKAATTKNHDRPLPPGSVRVSADRQQILGVKVATVREASRSRTLRTTGRVEVDEARNYRLITGMEGRVVRVLPGATGDIVKKGQLLAVTSYLPNFLIAQQTYVSALNTADRYKETEPTSLPGGAASGQKHAAAPVSQGGFADYIRSGAQVRTTRETLMTLGMGEQQVEELARTRTIVDNIEVRAPADSVIVGRSIYPEQKFDKGVEFYRLADLSHVWILADVSGDDGKYLRSGKVARVSVPNQSRTFQARVSAAVPQFDEASRILRVRLEADNPRYFLKPGMFLDVQVPVWTSPSLAVPVDAVVDTGLKNTVFVDHGGGVFEPRRVETGWRSGDQVQITKGLHRGERIVVSGNFLLDSESRMKQAAAEPQTKSHPRSARRM